MPISVSPCPSRSHRRSSRLSVLALVALLTGAIGAAPAAQAATAVTEGYRDHQYGDPAAPGGDDVTAGSAQSKLWFNDGRWFGILFDPRSTPNAKFRIDRFDMATQNWTSTTVPVDDRNRSHADVLSVGNTIYVASAHPTQSLRFYRYTYDPVGHSYVLGTGPIAIPSTTTGTGYATIARDSAGVLWTVFTQALRVRFSRSADNGATWSNPAEVPGQLHDQVAGDVAAVTAVSDGVRNGIEVLWDNQNALDDAFYSAIHLTTDVPATWQAVETVVGTPGTVTYSADNHLSLKTAPDGQPIAALKLGKDSDPGPNGTDPLITVVKRTGNLNAAGSWAAHPVTTVTVEGTRPILQLDTQHNQANVFLTDPTLASQGSQAIYRRTAPLDTLNFGTAAIGTPVIQSATESAINDSTSTKQSAVASSGMLVLATNIPTLQYFHACMGDPCPAAPVANFTTDTTSGPAPLTVQFTDTSTNTPTAWSWNFGDGGTSTLKNPSHTYAASGTYTVTLTASNPAGSDPVTKTDLITVAAPAATAYTPITPVRAFDTRNHVGSLTKLTTGIAQTGQVGGRLGIPSDAIAVTGNLTVVRQTKGGYLSIGPVAAKLGVTSSLNFPVGDVRANGVTIPLNDATNGTLSFLYKSGVAGATTDVLFDVTGYFRNTSIGHTYHDVAPKRFLDTRSGVGRAGALDANKPYSFDVTNRPDIATPDIPPGATAVTGNLTVVGQTASGYVSLGPDPATLTNTSTLNFPTGDTRANNVTVKLGTGGKLFAFYRAAAGSKTHLVFDITGYFTNDVTGARFVAVEPARVMDSRSNKGVVGAFTSRTSKTWQVGNLGGIDPAARAVIGNVTVVGQTRAGYASVGPEPATLTSTSTLNFPLGDTRANGMTVKLHAGGTLSGVYVGGTSTTATTHLIYDVFGYYK
jgi:PKD repeat protein